MGWNEDDETRRFLITAKELTYTVNAANGMESETSLSFFSLYE
jgi:hypothetical protein